MTVEQDVVKLQSDVERLKRKAKLYRDPFSKPEQLKLEQGTTGAARYRRLHLPWIKGGTLSINTSGSLRFVAYHSLPSGSANTVQYGNPVVPSDAIEGGFPKLKVLFSNRVGGDDMDIEIFTLAAFREGDTNTVLLYSELGSYTTYTINAVADTLRILSYDLTLPPRSEDVVGCTIGREGLADDNSGQMDIWGVWIEYLAFI